ncbi:GNAT family N-acetyltransferase [Niameybacter massiliensis]|uniref:GNAT family N-acetyltransferase n=1 Tax=Holtiella tumoricola TaxID=3018743 RepID=A0AA42DLX9_9FIRM|nr:GNAT family N-acetyltransferase [Holtiella tumoricola]MDA3731232.1 GNAT family N-acetyltransferase [Holtiella tumoricola]
MKVLETTRLVLRPWTLEDVEDLYDYAKDPRVGPNAGWPPHKDKEMSKKIVESFIKAGDVYAIELKFHHKVIGSIGLHEISKKDEFGVMEQREVGYVLHPEYWGMGYITEGVKAVLSYAFEVLHIDVIWCSHFEFNERSKHVIERCGFKYSFTENKRLNLLEKQEVKCLCYSLTRGEYALLS